MKQNLFLMLGLGAMLLTSCDQDIFNEVYLTDAGANSSASADSTKTSYLSINSTIAPSGNVTRAINDAWENGDAIGVYANYSSGDTWFSNGKFVRVDNTSTFKSSNTYHYNTMDEYDISAYYPYTSSVTASNPTISFSCIANAQPVSQKPVDFMYAQGTTCWGGTPSLVFQHKMSRVIFNIIAGDGFTDSEILETQGFEFNVNVIDKGTFNTKTGVVTPAFSQNYIYLTGTRNDNTSDAHCLTFELILPPQTLEGVEFCLDTNDYSLTSMIEYETSHTSWDAGYTYTYNVVLNKDSFTYLSSSIKPWTSTDEETIEPSF